MSSAIASSVSDPFVEQRKHSHRVAFSMGVQVQAESLLMMHSGKCCMHQKTSVGKFLWPPDTVRMRKNKISIAAFTCSRPKFLKKNFGRGILFACFGRDLWKMLFWIALFGHALAQFSDRNPFRSRKTWAHECTYCQVARTHWGADAMPRDLHWSVSNSQIQNTLF